MTGYVPSKIYGADSRLHGVSPLRGAGMGHPDSMDTPGLEYPIPQDEYQDDRNVLFDRGMMFEAHPDRYFSPKYYTPRYPTVGPSDPNYRKYLEMQKEEQASFPRTVFNYSDNPYGIPGNVDSHGLPLQGQPSKIRVPTQVDKYGNFSEPKYMDEQEYKGWMRKGGVPDDDADRMWQMQLNYERSHDYDTAPGGRDEDIPISLGEGRTTLMGGSGGDKLSDIDTATTRLLQAAPPGQVNALIEALGRLQPQEVIGLANAVAMAQRQGLPVSVIGGRNLPNGIGVTGIKTPDQQQQFDSILDQTGFNGPRGLARAAAAGAPPAAAAGAVARTPPAADTSRVGAGVVPFDYNPEQVTDPRFFVQQDSPLAGGAAPAAAYTDPAAPSPAARKTMAAINTPPLPRLRPDTGPSFAPGYKPRGFTDPRVVQHRDLVPGRGLHGDDVVAVQRQLASAGYKVPLTGRYDDPRTLAAVEAFQRDHPWTGTSVNNMPPPANPDRIVGPRTRKALEVVSSPLPNITPPFTGVGSSAEGPRPHPVWNINPGQPDADPYGAMADQYSIDNAGSGARIRDITPRVVQSSQPQPNDDFGVDLGNAFSDAGRWAGRQASSAADWARRNIFSPDTGVAGAPGRAVESSPAEAAPDYHSAVHDALFGTAQGMGVLANAISGGGGGAGSGSSSSDSAWDTSQYDSIRAAQHPSPYNSFTNPPSFYSDYDPGHSDYSNIGGIP